MLRREIAVAPRYLISPDDGERTEVNLRELSLEGLPSIDAVAANIRELRQYYFSWLSQRFNTFYPQVLEIVRDGYLFDGLATFIPPLFRYSDGRQIIRDGKTKPPNDFISWVNLCNYAIASRSGNIKWDGVRPLFNARLIEDDRSGVIFKPDMAAFPEGNTIKTEYLLLKERDYYKFDPPTLFYFMAAVNYFNRSSDKVATPVSADNYGEQLIQQLYDDHFLDKDIIPRSLPTLTFIAEDILLSNPSQLKNFITSLTKKIGGEYGFSVATAIMEDLIEIYRPLLETRITIFTDVIPALPLAETISELKNQYRVFIYENRPVVISHETLANALRDQPRFWEEIFVGSGVQREMENLFGKSENSDIRQVYETALRERKLIPGLIMILSHILGYNPEMSRRLAAISLFGWGVIVSYDNIIDSHSMRKGERTELATAGLPIALNNTMQALGELLGKTLNNHVLTERVLSMLQVSCRGDNQARSLGWGNTREEYINSMRSLVTAFSWFPEYICQQTGNTASGTEFASFLANVHTLGQLNNDIEDIEKNLWKHGEGSDIGQRITLFWKTLVELPENIVHSEEKQKVNAVYEKVSEYIRIYRRQPASEEIPEINEVLEIGRKHKKDVIQALYSFIKETIYEPAKMHLESSFAHLPVMDKTNITYQQILAAGLEQEWKKFCDAGEIEEITP